MRTALTLTLLALVLAGCDVFEDDIYSLDDVLVVGLEGEYPVQAVAFVTEGTPGCEVPIAYRTRMAFGVLTVEVEGLEVQTGAVCRAITPSAFAVALPSGTTDLEVRHHGEVDRYEVTYRDGGLALVPFRTSVTRLGPR